MPRGIRKNREVSQTDETADFTITERHDKAVERTVFDVAYTVNGASGVQTGFLSREAAESWIEEMEG